MYRYFVERSDFSLTQWRALGLYPTVGAPSFNQHGGLVASGFNLTITATNGTIYYTTNGLDPRVYGSGAISPQAAAYSGPVVVNNSMVVKSRTLVGNSWSALTEATFKVGELIPPLRVTEIMYNPIGGDAYEYIELRNVGGLPINLSGYTIQGLGFTFPPGSVYGGGATIVLASDSNPAGFAARYPGVSVAGYFSGRLDNGGERLTILDPRGHTVLSLDYNDANGWPTAADGRGYSLEIVDPNGDPDDPANWRASTSVNGTPGVPASTPPAPSVVLNELMADNLTAVSNAATHPDWVELHNTGSSPATLTGWSLSDDGNARKFVFPNGTTIPVNGYLVVWCDLPSAAPGLHTGFALGRKDESLFLYDNNTNLVDAISFGPQITDISIGRVNDAWQLTQPTPGAANAPLATAPQNALVINEWLANPPPGSGQDDWVELYNTSSQPISLKGIHIGNADALFQLRTLGFIPAHGHVQFLADENPGADHLDVRLAAGGGSIILYDSDGFQIDRINYGSQLEGVSQGRLPDGNATIRSFPGSSSPGAPNYINTQAGPIFNEVFVADGAQNGWVELLNTNQASVDLSGLTVNTVRSTEGGWTFAPGTSLAPNAFITVDTGQSLSANGGALYILSGSGQVLDSLDYGFQVTGMSIGRAAGQWTLLSSPTPAAVNASAAALGTAANLKINEWMANPADSSEADWFELYNPNSVPVRLTGLYITDNLSINGQTNWQIGPLSFIGGGSFVRFEASGDPGLGRNHVNFALAAGGEALRLSDPALQIIDTVAFGGQSRGVSQGRIPDGAADIVTFPQTPTPRASNYLPLDNARINEVLPNRLAPAQSAIEIYNPSSLGVDLGGWYLSNDPRNPKGYRIPNGTFLSAGGYLVFQATEFNFPLVGYLSLSEADSAGNLSGRRSVVTFDEPAVNKSFGVVQMCAGTDFAELTSISLGGHNAQPRIGPVVISEIMYRPPTLNGNENNLDEYLELQNQTAQDLALDDWQLRNAVNFTFPTNTSIPASGFLVVVGFDPVADLAQLIQFRSKFAVPEEAPVVGPWRGNLSNTGEPIELYRPGNILVERVVYDDVAPWPASGNGDGNSLQRTANEFGNDPIHWHADAPTAGSANTSVPAMPAAIVAQPVSRAVPAGTRVVFSVDVCGTSPLGYFWEWTGGALPNPSNPSYVIANVSSANSGMYRVAVSNAFGPTVYSEWATLTIQSPPVISQQPESMLTASGTNVSFTVAASGTGPFTYQWRKNGIALSGKTNATLDLFDVQVPDSGDYSALVGNAAGFVASAAANLEVYQRVRILTHPVSRTANTNTAVSFSVTATGTGTLRYQWRLMGQDLQGQTNATLDILSVQLEDSGDYTVLVYDNRSSAESLPATLTVLVRPSVVRHPQGMIVAVGSNVTVSAGVYGGWPVTNRWRRGSANIFTNVLVAKQTNATLLFPNIQTNQAAGYALGVVNGSGSSLLSSNAFITVVLPPTNTTVASGADARFTVQAFGLTRILYQWKSGNTDILGATNTTLIISNVQSSHAGAYSVVVNSITNTFIPPATFSATLAIQGGPPTLSEPRLLSATQFQFLLTGDSNATYAIQFSPDLTNWTTFTNVSGASTTTVTDPAATPSRRFYRARGP
ncbi:MAG TPA: lamin tail domain-containing protein [Verrucomicrobiae bacterium]|nr:lamin tail domain-containing protein [Verrucomicrobiae bacterium]